MAYTTARYRPAACQRDNSLLREKGWRGICHCDIKPLNFVFGDSASAFKSVKMTDLDLSYHVGEDFGSHIEDRLSIIGFQPPVLTISTDF